jgi:hypothetical protein
MAATALVDTLFEDGKKLLAALDEADLKVYAAYWMFSEDSESWTFNVASNLLAATGPQSAYRAVRDILSESHIDIPLHAIVVVPSDDRVLLLMSGAIQVAGVSRLSFSNNVINGVQMPDMVILRMLTSSEPLRTVPKTRSYHSGRVTPKQVQRS